MISINRETDYGCRVVLHLALLPPGERVTAQQIARRRIIPHALIRRVITRLAGAGLVSTLRGKGGGLALARPSAEISLLDVVQAMEGPLALNACVANPAACSLMRVCPVHEAWCKAHAASTELLSGVTFRQLASRGEKLEARPVENIPAR